MDRILSALDSYPETGYGFYTGATFDGNAGAVFNAI